MAEASEMETIVPSAPNTGRETRAALDVKFEKNPYKTQKYLEAEPKALGVTQIMLTLFFLSILGLNWNYYSLNNILSNGVLASVNIIAGSVAIAAQNLHYSTLKACLGMQVLACVFSVICFLISPSAFVDFSELLNCWGDHNELLEKLCDTLLSVSEHVTEIELLIQATQVALSATLAAYCCKVIQCCSPRTNVPVITVNTLPGPQ